MSNQSETEKICCPEFDPVPWDDKVFEWTHKHFIKCKVCTLFYMPLNFSSKMKKLDALIKKVDAKIPDWLCLSDHTSRWNMDVYLAVDKEVPGIENITLTGKFYSKVYEGPFKDSGKWCKNFKEIAGSKGFSTKKLYMWYTTCPKCAKKYGKNYVAIVGQVE